ncbi:MAG: hypothetical protein R3E04_04115 [Sphingobium sp.]
MASFAKAQGCGEQICQFLEIISATYRLRQLARFDRKLRYILADNRLVFRIDEHRSDTAGAGDFIFDSRGGKAFGMRYADHDSQNRGAQFWFRNASYTLSAKSVD